ncbi:MAG: hypothetical protein ACLQU5_35420 [Isosphaeraceae bacterium]
MGIQQKNKDFYMYHDNVDQQGQDKRPEGMPIAPLMGDTSGTLEVIHA